MLTKTGLKFWTVVGIQTGAIIGAGIFSLPYVFQRVGLVTGAVYLTGAALIMTLVHLMYGAVVAANSDHHNFVGYVRRYLGGFAGELAVVIGIVELLLVLGIFLILAYRFFGILTPQPLYAVLLFWGVASWVALSSIDQLGAVQVPVVAALLIVVVAVFLWGWANYSGTSVIEMGINSATATLAIGPLLFALGGRVGAGEATQYARAHQLANWRLRQAIILGTVIPAVIYILFVYGVLWLVPVVAEDSITSLLNYIPTGLLLFVVCAAIIKLWTSYAALGFDVFKNITLDLRWSPRSAKLMLLSVPLLVALWFQSQVITLIALTGGVFFFLEALLIFLMWVRFRRQRTD